MPTTVGLVACSKAKANRAMAAAQLYTSLLFRRATDYCRRHDDRWFILSARHGLVAPEQVLEPYDDTLAGRKPAERQAWAGRVVAELQRRGLGHAKFFLHAGRQYAGVLLNKLDCEWPLAGLAIGAQLAWYRRRAQMTDVLRVRALEVLQGGRPLYAFAVDGRLLHRFAAVSRVGRTAAGAVRGYQRPEILAHVAQIRAYLETDGALLPNCVVLAFDRPVRFRATGGGGPTRVGELMIPLAEDEAAKVAWVVDGQQRAAAVRAMARDGFPVWVTAFVARDAQEQRAQFLLVNYTRPLPRGLVHELLPGMDALLPPRLARKRFPAQLLDRLNRDADSPLRGRIRTATTPAGLIPDRAVLAVLTNSLADGVLRSFRATPCRAPDVEAILAVMKDYWRAVAAVFPEAWERPPRLSRLTHGAGIVALGFVLEEIAEQCRAPGLPTYTRFVTELSRLAPFCHWTPESGDWDLGGVRRRWNEFQNTPRDTRLLADLLCRAYRQVARDAEAGGSRACGWSQ
jgi:DGQHR domain-containing protein